MFVSPILIVAIYATILLGALALIFKSRAKDFSRAIQRHNESHGSSFLIEKSGHPPMRLLLQGGIFQRRKHQTWARVKDATGTTKWARLTRQHGQDVVELFDA
jgi:hypothetical protein